MVADELVNRSPDSFPVASGHSVSSKLRKAIVRGVAVWQREIREVLDGLRRHRLGTASAAS